MATRAGGRPSKEQGQLASRQVRIFEDLADMIAWIARMEGKTTSQIVDPVLRPAIQARYKMHEVQIKAVKKAEAEARAAAAKARGE